MIRKQLLIGLSIGLFGCAVTQSVAFRGEPSRQQTYEVTKEVLEQYGYEVQAGRFPFPDAILGFSKSGNAHVVAEITRTPHIFGGDITIVTVNRMELTDKPDAHGSLFRERSPDEEIKEIRNTLEERFKQMGESKSAI